MLVTNRNFSQKLYLSISLAIKTCRLCIKLLDFNPTSIQCCRNNFCFFLDYSVNKKSIKSNPLLYHIVFLITLANISGVHIVKDKFKIILTVLLSLAALVPRLGKQS